MCTMLQLLYCQQQHSGRPQRRTHNRRFLLEKKKRQKTNKPCSHTQTERATAVSKPSSALRCKASAIWRCGRLASSGCTGIFVSAARRRSPLNIPPSLGVAVRSRGGEMEGGEDMGFVAQRQCNVLLSWRSL